MLISVALSHQSDVATGLPERRRIAPARLQEGGTDGSLILGRIDAVGLFGSGIWLGASGPRTFPVVDGA